MPDRINQQIENNLAFVHDLALQNEEWISRPAWVEFATNNACNLRCVMCGQSDGETPQRMKREKAEEVFDQIFENATLITPHANSEPFLADFDLVLEKCREHDVHVNLITNATYLDVAKFEAIADRIWCISFSLDSHLRDVLERVRARIDYDLTIRNIRDVLPLAAAKGIRTAFNYVLMSANAETLPDFVDWVAEIGGVPARTVIHVQPMLYNAQGCDDMQLEGRFSEEQLIEILDRAADRARAHGVILDADLPDPLRRIVMPEQPWIRGIMPDLLVRTIETMRARYPEFCSLAAYYLKVNPNGDVYPCCVGPEELKMGSVHEDSIETIWNNEKYRAFRRRMFSGDYPDSCKNCEHLVNNPAFARDGRE